MADKTDAQIAEFFTTLVRFIKDQHAATTSSMIATSALVHAITERFPELADSYEKYRAEAEASSPLATSSSQIVAELDAYLSRMLEAMKRSEKT